jgi:hypothetical protein
MGLKRITKAVTGDRDEQVITAGTLATTRGVGIVAVGLIGVFSLLDGLGAKGGPWPDLSSVQKLTFVLGCGAIWALVAAADAIARGIATAATRPTLVALPPGLLVTRTTGLDSPGWHAAMIEVPGRATGPGPRYLVVKGDQHAWVPAEELSFR